MDMFPIYDLRLMRLAPEIVDERMAQVVKGLREREFLRGTVFEERALAADVDPYSLLLGILIGIGVTLVLGLATIEIWMPRVIARVTGKALRETTTAVMEILRG